MNEQNILTLLIDNKKIIDIVVKFLKKTFYSQFTQQ